MECPRNTAKPGVGGVWVGAGVTRTTTQEGVGPHEATPTATELVAGGEESVFFRGTTPDRLSVFQWLPLCMCI